MKSTTAKAISSVAICVMGAGCMYFTKSSSDPTGIGWAILGILIVWG